ncbi:MAG: arginine--tRNA ligase [Deltaproteobacteria bacterium]|nr:arginine--tRNA ligase [Deltaproteobacteria bacterium]
MRAESYVNRRLKGLIDELGLTWTDRIQIAPPKDARFGDVATNAAMILAPEARCQPRILAERIAERVRAEWEEIDRIETAGPGFLNFAFKPVFWQALVPTVLAEDRDFGRIDFGRGRKVQVEYVSANPTGPLHIGHGRGAAVGDALTRILRRTGHEVDTEYYLNDAGRQMRILGLSVWTRYRQQAGQNIPFPEDGYQGGYVGDIAGSIREAHGDGLLDWEEAKAQDFCREWAMRVILDGIREDLRVFRAEHQVWFSEQSLLDSGRVRQTLDDLLTRGLAYEQDGALWFASTRFGDDKDRVLRKSDGSLTYFASDIAYHADKVDRGFDFMVDIWGADHHGYVPRMKAAMQALGRSPESLGVILVQLVNLLRGGEQVAMSTRSGEFETLADVCAEVGVDAARFIFLSRRSDSHLDFDLDKVKEQSMDNPVYYVQYAYARICSLLAKAGERRPTLEALPDSVLSRLGTDEDLALLKQMDRFEDALVQAATGLSPHHVAYYLQGLAGLLHRYYTVHHILSGEDEELVQARLGLLTAVRAVLRNGLDLLGVQAPETM